MFSVGHSLWGCTFMEGHFYIYCKGYSYNFIVYNLLWKFFTFGEQRMDTVIYGTDF